MPLPCTLNNFYILSKRYLYPSFDASISTAEPLPRYAHVVHLSQPVCLGQDRTMKYTKLGQINTCTIRCIGKYSETIYDNIGYKTTPPKTTTQSTTTCQDSYPEILVFFLLISLFDLDIQFSQDWAIFRCNPAYLILQQAFFFFFFIHENLHHTKPRLYLAGLPVCQPHFASIHVYTCNFESLNSNNKITHFQLQVGLSGKRSINALSANYLQLKYAYAIDLIKG